jgi:uncharacterized protein
VSDTDPYLNLREQLNRDKNWPRLYMFKFIIPANNQQIAILSSKFSEDAVISQSQSSTGKYYSITIREVMVDANSIIDKYMELEGIPGLISL